jgi:thiamine kinase-like enzyme
MAIMRTDIRLFPFIQPTHPLHAHTERFQDLLNADPFCAEKMHMLNEGGPVHVHTLLRVHLRPDRGWDLKGFHTSFQSHAIGPQVDRQQPFRALTLFYTPHASQIDYREFPQDPYMTGLASLFGGALPHHDLLESGAAVDVLRYVPRLRLTFRAAALKGRDGGSAPAIGKVVRPAAAEAIHERLVKVAGARSGAARSVPATFSVAAPLGIDTHDGIVFQELKPGKELSPLLDQNNFKGLLYDIGRIHRDLHGLNVPDLPAWDFDRFLQRLSTYIECIAFFRPEQWPFLDNIHDLLLRRIPHVDSRTYTFCHGDFSCHQILKDGDCWSVVDFDGCLRGDPLFEIAKLMASLKYNVPLFRDGFRDPTQRMEDRLEEACESYVRGYEEQAQESVNQTRILWYRIAWEINYLARRFTRDQFHPVAFNRAIALIGDLSEQLRGESRQGDRS